MILRLPVYDERRHAFARVKNERVLVYWPHGFGDFVHFGYVVPLLESSNAYAIARFGDDFVHLYDGARLIEPIYCGVRAIGDGSAQGARHLGIEWKRIRNRPADVRLPEPLASAAISRGITSVLYTDYPDHGGKNAFPFHTKARALIGQLVEPARLASLDLHVPLRSALSFEVPSAERSRIEARLRERVGRGERLYLLAPGGHTNAAKTWPAQYARAFLERLATYDPAAKALVVEEDALRAQFGDLDVAFAHLLVTLIGAAHAVVGVPAGPLHAALAMRRGPVVGIWLAHYPDWYDEPYERGVHLTGPLVHARGYDRCKATTTLPPQWRARTLAFPRRVPEAPDVFEALDSVR